MQIGGRHRFETKIQLVCFKVSFIDIELVEKEKLFPFFDLRLFRMILLGDDRNHSKCSKDKLVFLSDKLIFLLLYMVSNAGR